MSTETPVYLEKKNPDKYIGNHVSNMVILGKARSHFMIVVHHTLLHLLNICNPLYRTNVYTQEQAANAVAPIEPSRETPPLSGFKG